MIRNFSDLSRLKTFGERFDYLVLAGKVGVPTFGSDRYYNQRFYQSNEWRSLRHQVIVRDEGCDLGVLGLEIFDNPTIHHIVPLTVQDFVDSTEALFSLDNLITVSRKTHNAIHYGGAPSDENRLVQRYRGDTVPWKKAS